MATKTGLNSRTRFALTQRMHTQYTAAGLNDVDFAKLMEKELGAPITAHHVKYIRTEFDIPAAIKPTGGAAAKNAAERIDLLNARVDLLENEVELLHREVKECLHLKGNSR